MSRKSTILLRLITGMALLGAAWTAGTGAAEAQCASSCNQSAHHWNLGSSANADNWRIGMVLINGLYYPARCDMATSSSAKLLADGNFTYTTPQLTANASVCMGGGADTWRFIEAPMSCSTAIGPMTIVPINLNGRRLTISGEAGNDDFEIGLGIGSAGNVGQYAMCGGADNDRLLGGYDTQLIFGGSGNDFLRGDRQNDEIRGGSGQDVILHPTNEGTDLVIGETGTDCIYAGGPTQAGSSCTAEWGVVNYYQSNGTALDWCTDPVASCCAVSPAC